MKLVLLKMHGSVQQVVTEVEERQGAEAVRDHRRHVQREHRLLDSTHGQIEDQMLIFTIFF